MANGKCAICNGMIVAAVRILAEESPLRSSHELNQWGSLVPSGYLPSKNHGPASQRDAPWSRRTVRSRRKRPPARHSRPVARPPNPELSIRSSCQDPARTGPDGHQPRVVVVQSRHATSNSFKGFATYYLRGWLLPDLGSRQPRWAGRSTSLQCAGQLFGVVRTGVTPRDQTVGLAPSIRNPRTYPRQAVPDIPSLRDLVIGGHDHTPWHTDLIIASLRGHLS